MTLILEGCVGGRGFRGGGRETKKFGGPLAQLLGCLRASCELVMYFPS
jgi:hypothetical protein